MSGNADLRVRIASAVTLVVITGTALWFGRWWWNTLVVIIAMGVFFEWHSLIKKFTKDTPVFWFWCMGGIIYIGFATHTLLQLNLIATSSLLLVVTATDVGAYFAGRTIGGPKIAPSISPSKTWAGLTGGAVLAALTMMAIGRFGLSIMQPTTLILCGLEGALMATVAQAGDFFQSWMKRRAGVKDSGGLIPGHGGLFDRVDGLLAVSFLIGLV